MKPNYSSCEDDKKFTDADLDILQRDLNECQKAMSQISGGSNNFIEAFFPNNPNSYSTANDFNNNLTVLPPIQTQFHHFTRLLHDFEEFETEMLPPSSQRPDDQHCTTNGNGMDQDYYLAREIQESQVMIEEMAEEDDDRPASDPIFVLQGNLSSDPSRRVNTDFPAHDVCACYDVAGGGGSGMASFSNNYDCAGSSSSSIQQGGLGLYLQGSSGITFFEGSSSVRYFICSSRNTGANNFEKARKTGRKKRRYNGVVETDEETARRVECAKIKNREAAAKAHLRKLSHETHLQTLLLKLRKKNKFLKNVLMFLQGHKRIDVPPKTLRRTISGPI